MAQAQTRTRSAAPAAAKTTGGSRSRASAKTTAQAGAQQDANGKNLQQMENDAGTEKTVLASTTPAPSPASDLTTRANAIVQEGERAKAVAEGKLDMDMSRISHKSVVAEIAGAAGTFKTAINMEAAACLAVYMQAGGVNIGSKKKLYEVYSDAGYDCGVGGKGKDYKTVNRRIGYIGKLFEALPEGTLEGVIGDKTDHDALRLLVGYLAEKYNFRSMNDVLTAAGVEPPSVAQYRNLKDLVSATVDTQMKGEVFEQSQTGNGQSGNGGTDGSSGGAGGGTQGSGGQPQGGSGGGASTDADTQQPTGATAGVAGAVAAAGQQRQETGVQASRREEDDPSKYRKFTFDGATLIVPLGMKVECITDLGIRLMDAARKMKGETVDLNVLAESLKEVEAHH